MRLGAYLSLLGMLTTTTEAQPNGVINYKQCKACLDADKTVCLVGS